MTFVILLVSAGVRAVPAVLMLPLEQEFGWLRTTTSAALSVNILLYGMTGPFAGSLMARVGVRRVVLSALTLLACGVAIAPLIRYSWQLVALWGLGIGVGTALIPLAAWLLRESPESIGLRAYGAEAEPPAPRATETAVPLGALAVL